MDEGNGSNGKRVPYNKMNEGSSSSEGHKDSDKAKQTETVPFYKLFAFADSNDLVLMIIGTIGAIGNGLSIPIMTVLFGELTDSFGENQTSKDVLRIVARVIYRLFIF